MEPSKTAGNSSVDSNGDKMFTWATGFRSSVGHLTQFPTWESSSAATGSAGMKSRYNDLDHHSPQSTSSLMAESPMMESASKSGQSIADFSVLMKSPSLPSSMVASGQIATSFAVSSTPVSAEDVSDVRLLKMQLEQSRQSEQLMYQQLVSLERKHEELRLKYHKLKVKVITLERENRKDNHSVSSSREFNALDLEGLNDKSGSSTPTFVATPKTSELTMKYTLGKKKPTMMLNSAPFSVSSAIGARQGPLNQSLITSPMVDNKVSPFPPTEFLITPQPPMSGHDHDQEVDGSTGLSSGSDDDVDYSSAQAIMPPVPQFVGGADGVHREICRHFLKGKCRFKKDCKFSHVVEQCPYCGEKPPSGKIAASAHLARCWKAYQQKMRQPSD
jgi:hypothetical protein